MQEVLAAQGEAIWQPEEQRRSNAVFDGRSGNMQKFKPGVEAVILMFSDRAAETIYTFPWYHRFKAAIEPLLRQVRCLICPDALLRWLAAEVRNCNMD